MNYYLRRIREAGIRSIALKAAQRVLPYIYWPLYVFGPAPRAGQPERECLRQFGAICVEAFLAAKRTDPSRTERVAKRLSIAEAPDFPVLGYGNLDKPHSHAWHADPKHHYTWKARYFPFCDFVASDIRADVKIPWELSRLQWLVWIAEAVIGAEPDERARLGQSFLHTVEDWAAANPVGFGVNWCCGMEVAIRGANLAVAASVFAQYIDDEAIDRLIVLLRVHQNFLARFPEVSDVPGNHYLTDLMGEVVIHAALDGLSSPVTSRAMARFAAAAESQFEDGGSHIERATIYHRLTVDIVALLFAIALRSGDASSATLAPIVQRAAQFMAQIASDSGRMPVFGDQDSGFVIWFGERAQVVDRRLCGAPGAPETDLYSFLSAFAGKPFFPLVSNRQAGSRSGFGTLVAGAARVTMKTGQQGLRGRAPHDHDDALCLAASWGLRDLLIDPGCHSYTLDPVIRHKTISSSRHNAPVPATRERFAPTQGSINATVRGAPTATLTAYAESAMEGHLNATSAARMAVTRQVLLNDSCLHITDIWQFETPESARIMWLIDPAWHIEGHETAEIPAEGLTLRLTAGQTTLTAQIVAKGARLRVLDGLYSPD